MSCSESDDDFNVCRKALGREPDAMLSEGTDRKLLQTEVHFLSGREGQYRLGSVVFRAEAERATPCVAAADRHPETEQPADTGETLFCLPACSAPHENMPWADRFFIF